MDGQDEVVGDERDDVQEGLKVDYTFWSDPFQVEKVLTVNRDQTL
jgi:hypothetical protein